MQFDATSIEMISAVAKELNEHDLILVLQSLSLKHHELLPVISNMRFSNDLLTVEDFHDIAVVEEEEEKQKTVLT